MIYSISEIAEICGISKTATAWRLNKLGLKSPHDDTHLAAVRDYVINQHKPVTIWQLVSQRYDQEHFKSKYQNTMYRWRKLGSPSIQSLDELDDLWNKHTLAKKEKTEEYKKHQNEQSMSQFSKLVNKRTKKIRHLYIWKTFDSSGVWDDEVLCFYQWYTESGFKPCESRRLAYIEVLKRHHMLDQDEYFDFKESKTPLKMVLEGVENT